ncbi:hypothetical protein EUX98_g2664 [Antrodiella citrinella]|uniref:Uncharacterized protein n=1 Tax=Antrodiella citrinella TaxID=2447956 RepID=A0A4S4N1C7_9APHY|nr:hypothetical protein EUX98_g2664 [Antrodiella citrinella]
MADPSPLPVILELLLDYLSDVLPPTAYTMFETVLEHTWALASSLFTLIYTAITSSFDVEKLLPPLITLLAAYLALVSFYRTTGWMIRTALAFVKWGFILTTLGAAAGYILSNGAFGAAGNGLGALGGGLVPMIGGFLLGLFNGEEGSNANKKSSFRSKAQPRRRPQTKSQSRPKAWESWDKQKGWQYDANANEGREAAEHVQKVVGEVLGAASRVVTESGWWEAAKGVVDDIKTQADMVQKGSSRRKAKTDKATKSR